MSKCEKFLIEQALRKQADKRNEKKKAEKRQRVKQILDEPRNGKCTIYFVDFEGRKKVGHIVEEDSTNVVSI